MIKITEKEDTPIEVQVNDILQVESRHNHSISHLQVFKRYDEGFGFIVLESGKESCIEVGSLDQVIDELLQRFASVEVFRHNELILGRSV